MEHPIMWLVAKDQVHLSGVKSDSLREGERFEVSDARGRELLEKTPHLFAPADAEPSGPSSAKALPPPQNKADLVRKNKRGEQVRARKSPTQQRINTCDASRCR
jgi:hypothetical protein